MRVWDPHLFMRVSHPVFEKPGTSVKPKSRSNFTHFEVKIKDFLIFAS